MKLSDFWWLRTNGRGHKYVCPLLMTLSLWGWRLRGKRCYWRMGGYTASVVFSGDKSDSVWESPCLFPRRLILAECNFWNSRIGTRLRLRGIGSHIRQTPAEAA